MNIAYRTPAPYMVISQWVATEDISRVLPPLIAEVAVWLENKNIAPSGPPFFEYRVMKPGRMHVCVGFPVPVAADGDDRIHPGAFPEGEYATARYTGSYEGLRTANEMLNQWFERLGYEQRFLENNDNLYSGSRTEFYLTDPATEPDERKWRTDLAVWVKPSGRKR